MFWSFFIKIRPNQVCFIFKAAYLCSTMKSSCQPYYYGEKEMRLWKLRWPKLQGFTLKIISD